LSDIIKYEQHGAVAVITLFRPESMNAFDTELRAALVDAFARAHADDSVRVVVFTGEGRCFSAGADLKAGIERDVEEILQIEYRPVQEELAKFRNPLSQQFPAPRPASVCRWPCSAT